VVALQHAVFAVELDRHAFDEEAVEAPVLLDQPRILSLTHPAQRVRARLSGQGGVQAVDRGAQTVGERHIAIAGPFGVLAVGRNIVAVPGGVAQPGQPFERGLLDVALGEGSAHATPAAGPRTKRARSRRSIS